MSAPKVKCLFLNDWGINPNPRIFYIADYFRSECQVDTTILGRSYKSIPNRDDLVLVNPSFIKDNAYPRGFIKINRLRFSLLKACWRILRKEKPEYLYIRSLYFSILAGWLKRFFNFRIIFETHGFAYKEQLYKGKKIRAKFSKVLEKMNFKRIDWCVTNTAALARNIANEYGKESQLFTIPNGVDMAEFQGLNTKGINKPKDEKWLGTAGRDWLGYLWDAEGQQQMKLVGHQAQINAIVFSS